MVLPLIGALVGGGLAYAGSKKQSDAVNNATEASMAGFKQYQPYVDENLARSEGALKNVLDQGVYTGDTYAGPNQDQLQTVDNMASRGGYLQNAGFKAMADNAGFGQNYNDLYGQSQGLYGQTQDLYDQSRGIYGQNQDLFGMNQGLAGQFQGLSDGAKADRLATANQYAVDNSGSLVDAAMRDDRRNLMENTLTGIDMAASGTGNTNSSRAGVANAIANRGYDDRRADVSMGIQDRLVDRSLANQARQFSDQNAALQNVGTTYNNMGNNLTGASSALRGSGGFLGDSANMLTNAGNMNQGIQSAYNTGLNTLGEGANFSMNAGNTQQGFDQAALNDAQMRYNNERDFNMNQIQGYQSGILNQAPNSMSVSANTVNPYKDMMGGAMQGFGYASDAGYSPYYNAQNSMFNPLFGGSSGLGIMGA